MIKLLVDDLFSQFKREKPELCGLFEIHRKSIEISDFKNTGIGCYIDFIYKKEPQDFFENFTIIGLEKSLYINEISYPFDVILSFNLGKIAFIEIVTYGAIDWDGVVEKWYFDN